MIEGLISCKELRSRYCKFFRLDIKGMVDFVSVYYQVTQYLLVAEIYIFMFIRLTLVSLTASHIFATVFL